MPGGDDFLQAVVPPILVTVRPLFFLYRRAFRRIVPPAEFFPFKEE